MIKENSIENYIKSRLKQKDILLMTHIVIGYPSLARSYEIVQTMVEVGVDLMELQIPFSEPIADGPVILNANQKALASNISVQDCLSFAKKTAQEFPIPFLFMSYYNIFFKYGIEKFIRSMADCDIKGAIIPDLPFEEGGKYLSAMQKYNLSPVFLFSPTTPKERLKKIAAMADGFIYCVARKGITGMRTSFSEELDRYLERCREATRLPLALGFGVKEKADIDYLKGKVEIAIIGTQSIKVMEEEGIDGLKRFFRQVYPN